MSQYFDIAYAAVNNRLCFITGAGFTKAITNQEAPTWEDLLRKLCEKCDSTGDLEKTLFTTKSKGYCSKCDKEHEILFNKSALALDELAEVVSRRLKDRGLIFMMKLKK